MKRITLQTPVEELKGVGEARKKALNKIGIFTVGDLCFHFPRAYQNRGEICNIKDASGLDSPCALVVTVGTEPKLSMIRRGMSLLKFRVFDDSGTCEAVFFNQNFLKNVFHIGDTYRFWGKVDKKNGSYSISSPLWEAVPGDVMELPGIVPIYPLSAGLKQKYLSGLVRSALDSVVHYIPETLPEDVRRKNSLVAKSYAVEKMHFPENIEALEKARRRFIFEELYMMALAMGMRRLDTKKQNMFPVYKKDMEPFFELLPYKLTASQLRTVDEIAFDMSSEYPMKRIIAGDVGSGKTVCAEAAIYLAISNGYQAAFMAPTEILAKQHYNEIMPLFKKLGYNTALLCGSTSQKNKKHIYEALVSVENDSEKIDVIIGTHSLISDNVVFSNLGLVITDEQHRFGVMQRARLEEKNNSVHTLVMSATPIPRTLSLILYKELSVSKLEEMPEGRQKISTFIVDESYRARLDNFIKEQTKNGRQTYIVCPAIEEKKEEFDSEEAGNIFLYEEKDKNDKAELKAAKKYAEELCLRLEGIRVGLVHGKMKSQEKDQVMTDFAQGNIDVLVSTTVIEVGVNVPNAVLMIVENAERFGLAQLHQLRGRVGRGRHKSYCVLVSDSKNENAKKRLEIIKKSTNGFEIAEADLSMRGPGDFFLNREDIRQSGAPLLKYSADCTDKTLISEAFGAAEKLIEEDSELLQPDHITIRHELERLRKNSSITVN